MKSMLVAAEAVSAVVLEYLNSKQNGILNLANKTSEIVGFPVLV